jgi:hypothetical protein
VVRPRGKLAVALTSGAAVMIGVTVVSAADAGYRFDGGHLTVPEHEQGHVYLHALGDPPALGITVALVMLAAAGYYGIAHRAVRTGGAVAVGLAVVLVSISCIGGAMLNAAFGESDRSTVAVSANYVVVQYVRSGVFNSDDVVLRLRSRRGLLSYEGDADIACFIAESSGAGPEWLFDHASLTTAAVVQVVAKDGTTWDIGFDPHTLRPVNPVDRCTNAPDPIGAD